MAVSRETIAAFRFGYGYVPGERKIATMEALLSGVTDPASAALRRPTGSFQHRRSRFREILNPMVGGRPPPPAGGARRQLERDYLNVLIQRAFGQSALFERMVAFWLDHFTVIAKVSFRRLLIPAYEADAIRPHVAGRFEDMLVAVVRHPMMMGYLDQTGSIGPNSPKGAKSGRGLNENLARELLELHTLGVDGSYTQQDVRQLAELLTGFSQHPHLGTFQFKPSWAEPGVETVLGKTYGGSDQPHPAEVEEVLVDLARHPATAQHIAWKLATHFVADEPPLALIDHIAVTWQQSQGYLPTVYRALLEHPAAWQNFGAKIRWPIEYAAAMIRSLGSAPATLDRLHREARPILNLLRDMGQPMYRPNGPDGWEEEAAAWITPQALSARLKAASVFADLAVQSVPEDPRAFAADRLRDCAHPDTIRAIGLAADRREGFALTFASPEFNRR